MTKRKRIQEMDTAYSNTWENAIKGGLGLTLGWSKRVESNTLIPTILCLSANVVRLSFSILTWS
jgi:hypothetical protein